MTRLTVALLLVFAGTASAEPFPARRGGSGLLDVPSGEVLPGGAAQFGAEICVEGLSRGRPSFAPSPLNIGVGLGSGFEFALSFREGGQPGDPERSPLLFTLGAKYQLVKAERLRPAVAVDAALDRYNVDPAALVGLSASTDRARGWLVAAALGTELSRDERSPVSPTGGLAVSYQHPVGAELVGEAFGRRGGYGLGAAARFAFSGGIGVSLGATWLPEREGGPRFALGIAFTPPTGLGPAKLAEQPSEVDQVIASGPEQRRTLHITLPGYQIQAVARRELPRREPFTKWRPGQHTRASSAWGRWAKAPAKPAVAPEGTPPEEQNSAVALAESAGASPPGGDVDGVQAIEREPEFALVSQQFPAEEPPAEAAEGSESSRPRRPRPWQLGGDATKPESSRSAEEVPVQANAAEEPASDEAETVWRAEVSSTSSELEDADAAVVQTTGTREENVTEARQQPAVVAGGTQQSTSTEGKQQAAVVSASGTAQPTTTAAKQQGSKSVAAHDESLVVDFEPPAATGPLLARVETQELTGESREERSEVQRELPPEKPDARPAAKVTTLDPEPPASEKLRQGGPGQRQLQAAVVTRQPDLKRCLDKHLKRHPTSGFDTSITVTVNPSGRVARVSVGHAELRGQYFETCLQAEAKAWSFPYSGEEYEVEVPLKLVAQDQ